MDENLDLGRAVESHGAECREKLWLQSDFLPARGCHQTLSLDQLQHRACVCRMQITVDSIRLFFGQRHRLQLCQRLRLFAGKRRVAPVLTKVSEKDEQKKKFFEKKKR